MNFRSPVDELIVPENGDVSVETNGNHVSTNGFHKNGHAHANGKELPTTTPDTVMPSVVPGKVRRIVKITKTAHQRIEEIVLARGQTVHEYVLDAIHDGTLADLPEETVSLIMDIPTPDDIHASKAGSAKGVPTNDEIQARIDKKLHQRTLL